MTKGSYAVGNPPKKDTSFRSFICVLLIFLAICLIILLATINWGGKSNQEPKAEENDEIEILYKKELQGNTPFEKIVQQTTNLVPKESEEIFEKEDKQTTTLKTTTRNTEKITTRYSGKEDTTTTAKITTRNSDFSKTTAETTSTNSHFGHSIKEEVTIKSDFENLTTTGSSSTSVITLQPEAFTDFDHKLTTEDTTSGILLDLLTTSSSKEVTQENRSFTTIVAKPELVTEFLSNNPEETKITGSTAASTKSEEDSFSTTKVGPSISYEPKENNKSENDSFTTTATPKVSILLQREENSSTTVPPQNLRSTPTTTTKPSTLTPVVKITTPKTQKICRKSVCTDAATHILSLMNHTADPCEDFYEFACGSVERFNEESDREWFFELLHTFNESSKKYFRDFHKFYQSCVKHEDDFNYVERIRKVEELLSEVGRFQFQNDTESSYNLTELVAKLILRQSMPLFDVSVDVDKQSSNFILQLTLPGQSFLKTGLENWSGLSLHKDDCLKKQKSQTFGNFLNLDQVYQSYKRCHNDYGHYIDSIDQVISQLDAFSNLASEDRRKEIKEIRFKIEFDILNKLTFFLPTDKILYEFINKKYDVRKISDLQLHYPVLQWNKLFEDLIGREIPSNSTVQVYFGDYFNEIFKSWNNIDFRILNNVFLSIYANDLFVNTVIPKNKSNRDRYCLDLTKQLMPEVWSSLVESTITQEERLYQNKMITDLFTELKSTFCGSLQTINWLDPTSKIVFAKKCDSLNLTLFTPPEEHILDDNNRNLNVTEDYQTNLIKVMVLFRQSIYSMVGKPFSNKTIFSYFLDPLSQKALSSYSTNLIAVPPGLVRKAPNGLPTDLRLARVGLNLARQMARHFDPTGIRYWTRLDSNTAYSNLIDTSIVPLYQSSPRVFNHKNITFRLNGSLSTNEKIVDNTAVRLISDLYISRKTSNDVKLPWISDSYSQDKIFFIAIAQEFCQRTTILDFMLAVAEGRHLAPVLRVENIMINSETFSEKFSCSEGAGMNPPIEKIQFPYLPTEEYDGSYDETKQSEL